ncbi:Cys-tRNA(Pro) deacylase [Vibrio vulnificus]|uniref:Cys-tRNA(Pro)/Cys-tRNA(Cys) deacylase n=1 Tax=Vibrio vulnificus TaxID=672 RepID=A0AAN1PR43_VIBVL|nr:MULTISPECIES: Cys-tRNA(Pro) deacylase [Vibrio]ADV87309.1 YbaK family protein [Vibrio vulnificus MO6-24/O]AMG11465.1 Cys-tRNA(Pro) deacylase [Vibrio vulnificus]ANN27319.1 Cys-tRNA(Pro) deacylase YbaK [Vibrio vulnificus]AXX60577.1 Cys-tRNA(Pro) deacylase YbaK [Vibrio vulnificus]EGQ7698470.1 Cys-tRNA(Pro) deacylase [Vibrio vulnificus]
MTPAINLAKKKKVPHTIHEYQHDPRATSYGLEAAEVLGQDPKKVFKTLLFCLNGEAKNLAVAIIPVDQKLNLKLAAKAANGKKADMADPEIAQKTTGYVVGGISPLGQKKALPTFLHISAEQQETICVSAGKRGLEIELAPKDLLMLTRGHFAELCLEA